VNASFCVLWFGLSLRFVFVLVVIFALDFVLFVYFFWFLVLVF
jgi:hypothetical protein